MDAWFNGSSQTKCSSSKALALVLDLGEVPICPGIKIRIENSTSGCVGVPVDGLVVGSVAEDKDAQVYGFGFSSVDFKQSRIHSYVHTVSTYSAIVRQVSY